MELGEFPLDLVREIVEWAALSNTQAAKALALSCKPIHAWVAPIINEFVVIYSEEQVKAFIKRMISSQQPFNGCRYIKRIAVCGLTSSQYAAGEFIRLVILYCPILEFFGGPAGDKSSRIPKVLFSKESPTQLCATQCAIKDCPFPFLTHLFVPLSLIHKLHPANFPSVTHFATRSTDALIASDQIAFHPLTTGAAADAIAHVLRLPRVKHLTLWSFALYGPSQLEKAAVAVFSDRRIRLRTYVVCEEAKRAEDRRNTLLKLEGAADKKRPKGDVEAEAQVRGWIDLWAV